MLQNIGTNIQFINVREGRELSTNFEYLGLDTAEFEVFGTIRTISVYVDEDPKIPHDATYHVKVVDVDSVGTKTVYLGPSNFDDEINEMKPIHDGDLGTVVMEFSLHRESYTNTNLCGLKYLYPSDDKAPFKGTTSRLNYNIQFNKYLINLWSKKVVEKCIHIDKKIKLM